MVFLSFLSGTRVNGRPSPNDLAKSVSDGVGPHRHGPFPLHPHGEPTFTDEAVAYLEQRGLHVDRHHGSVRYENGMLCAPGVVSSMLADAREEGVLTGDPGPLGNVTMKALDAGVSGWSPGEVSGTQGVSPVVQHLDLRGGGSPPG